ncbi:MAG: hypothetical protein LBE92_19835 [Chryseobacterium sp.]|jgi:hypothetical protein|uniref:hypothetical protein n=1 Tax=Chryseobacterium sp. TaxID=1871047 RepID=UPI00281DB733|nr:hypothetical protein [Chryseobacterium sp.]MDR2238383.1 hypothetical protein [Chryseobacterium sp.]
MKIAKTVLSLVSAIFCYIQGNAQSDSIYARINVYEPAQFKEVYLPQHQFVNPTLDFSNMVDDFIPEAKSPLPNQYENRTLNGKIKKITKFRKFPKETEKQMVDIHFFNKNGFLEKVNFMFNSNTYFHYDTRNRLIRKETLRENDTLNIRQYAYNDKNQITRYTESYFEKGKRRDGPWGIVYEPHSILLNSLQPDGTSRLVVKYTYDGNKVKTENYADGAVLQNTGHEFIYSENNNLISRKSREYNTFFCYDRYNRRTREISIMLGKTWDVRTRTYDKNGSIIRFSHENPVSKLSGSTEFRYDQFRNKIYEASGPDVTVNPYEYFYEIEYY